MSVIETLIEQFEKGKKPKDLIKEGYAKSTVYEAYRRFKAREEAKKTPIVEVFKRLEEGKSLPKIVIETGLDPDKVKEIYNKWLELRKIDVNQPVVLKEIEELKEKLSNVGIEQLGEINKLLKALKGLYIIKCPTCGVILLVDKTRVRIGQTVRCYNNHTFALQKAHIIYE
ncbi:MAG: hypothetical protein DRJ31_09425 [Candidatus Methanomethylicota archaeon]|uniref:Uncharacterized protein n=1 Tax=Thermoproteota archaeon TaxID=2056631 RepID=A0A497EK14_9CREN|nr:MAG: hypothetical protein DRJ31_09425 [Candidatus Verstraetearchaeota archaeon]